MTGEVTEILRGGGFEGSYRGGDGKVTGEVTARSWGWLQRRLRGMRKVRVRVLLCKMNAKCANPMQMQDACNIVACKMHL